MITTVIAGDFNFKKYVEKSVEYSTKLGYNTLVYDLGNLGFGEPFEARVTAKIGAMIPSKPNIIKHALANVNEGDIVAWIDADALIVQRFDEIADTDFDIGVTVRQPKARENSLPINAGIVFLRKTSETLKFVDKWVELCESGVSDQQELNKLAQITTQDMHTTVIRDKTKIHAFPCRIYNNFYFSKKSVPHAKIKHYKSKLRNLFPL